MRIAILTNLDLGLYRFRKELLQKLCNGNEVYIVLPEGNFIDRLQEIGCVFVRLDFNRRGKNPLADLRQIGDYRRILKEIYPDVVLTYTIKPNIYGGIACQKNKIPYINNVTGLGTSIEGGGLLRWVSISLYRAGIKKASCVFFQNASNRQLFEEKRVFRGKTRLLPGSGVNLEEHQMEDYPSDESGIRFLFVGRIMRDKGIEELLGAVREVQKNNSRIIVDIVGAADEDYSEALKHIEEEGGIRYHGMQSEMHPFYRDCHCLILPSYHEGMANVLLEAASTGRPVIATRVPGCQETFEEGVTGLGCEPRNTESLAEAIKKFLSLTQVQRIAMGKAAREKMEREFDREIVINAYMEEIENAVSNSIERQ